MTGLRAVFAFIALALGAADAAPLEGQPLYGVDYYPEQWPDEQLESDLRRIRYDLGAGAVRLAEFSWHLVEPQDGAFNFSYWHKVLDACHGVGLRVILGTPTATMPAWLAKKHPEVLGQNNDGTVRVFGGRRQYSFNSRIYREYALRVTTKMAEEFGLHPAVAMWQIDNELGHEGSDDDYSDASQGEWREWLASRHGGSIAALNREWGTTFWSETYNSFEEIPVPKPTITHHNPGLLLDWGRFRAHSIQAFMDLMIGAVRNHSERPVMTNLPGGFFSKKQDFSRMARSLDVVGYDNYPVWGVMEEPASPARVALRLDIVRSLGLASGGKPFLVPEQLIGAQGHDVIGYRPRPEQAPAWATQALVHGAGAGLLFFRYRAAAFGTEEFCYGVLDQDDVPRRKWNETRDFFHFARQNLIRQPVRSQVALLYSYDNAFAWQAQPQSTSFDYENELARFHEPFFRHGARVDVLDAVFAADALRHGFYKVVLLPAPMLLPDGLADALEAHVHNGGALWVGFRSDIKTEANQMRRSPSRLAALAGVDIADFESLNSMVKKVRPSGAASGAGTLEVSVWRDLLDPVPGKNVERLFDYADAAASGYAAATRRTFPGGGEVTFIGTAFNSSDLIPLAVHSLKQSGVEHFHPTDAGPQVELALQEAADGSVEAVLMSFAETETEAAGVRLHPFERKIVPYETLRSRIV